MKNFWKFAAVGLAGYFVGIYEFKYKVTKAMLESYLEVDKEDSNEEKEKEA